MNCFLCGKYLYSDVDVRRRDDFPQYNDALVIKFEGGYGMFIDAHKDFVICHDDAAKLIVNLPDKMREAIYEV